MLKKPLGSKAMTGDPTRPRSGPRYTPQQVALMQIEARRLGEELVGVCGWPRLPYYKAARSTPEPKLAS